MRRILALLCGTALLLSLAGCAALFDKELYAEEPYEGPAETLYAEEDAAATISNYTALRRAIARLVAEHAESAELQFQNYDGSISQDISTACWEVKSSTALGAFAVDYISYDLSRIISYYQAEIHITYKRSDYQVSVLESVENLSAMRARLDRALRAGETYLVLELTAASLTADVARQSVEQAYYGDPLACPVLPEVEAGIYPESGMDRILEVTLDYGLDGESLSARRDELGAAVDAAAAACRPAEEGEEPSAPEVLETLCAYLSGNCLSDEAAEKTAWAALTQGAASSEGVAMAMEAVCQAMGIPCQPVSGLLYGEPHVWSIVTLDGLSYHIDPSRWTPEEENVFLAGDADIWGAYWWDTREYPACPTAYGASGETSEEPASAESPAEDETP